jgi:hypothetical protein
MKEKELAQQVEQVHDDNQESSVVDDWKNIASDAKEANFLEQILASSRQ